MAIQGTDTNPDCDPAALHKRIGKLEKINQALMDRVDARARDAGCSLSSLEVFGSNTNAIRLYDKLGFETVAERDLVASPYLDADTVILFHDAVEADAERPPRESVGGKAPTSSGCPERPC